MTRQPDDASPAPARRSSSATTRCSGSRCSSWASRRRWRWWPSAGRSTRSTRPVRPRPDRPGRVPAAARARAARRPDRRPLPAPFRLRLLARHRDGRARGARSSSAWKARPSSGRSSRSRSRRGSRDRSARPSGRALPTEVVASELLPSAMALRSIAGQAAVIGGPVLGGVLFAIRPELVYGVAAAMLLVGLSCVLALGPPLVARTRPEPAPRWETPARRDRLHPPHAGDTRCDLARPLRGLVRRRGRAAARLRAVDPAHRAGRPRRAAKRARRRSARRRDHPRPTAARASHRKDAPRRRRAVRGEHGRLRAVPLVRALARRARASAASRT